MEAIHIILSEVFPQLATHVPGVEGPQNLLSGPSRSVAVTTTGLTATEELGDKRVLVEEGERVDLGEIDASPVNAIRAGFQ